MFCLLRKKDRAVLFWEISFKGPCSIFLGGGGEGNRFCNVLKQLFYIILLEFDNFFRVRSGSDLFADVNDVNILK